MPMTPVKSGGFILKSTVTSALDTSHHVVRVIKPGNGKEDEPEPYEDEIPPIELAQGKSGTQVTSNQENNLPEIIGAIIFIVLIFSLFWILFAKI